jgi:hypothetical protein
MTGGAATTGGAAVVRRARLIALAVGGFLLPWCVLLLLTLPASARASHWALAWTGLDAAEAAAALATALLLARGDRRASLTAMAGATLLILDAWFDVCTSAAGQGQELAIGEAVLVELPLAAAAIWLALRLLTGPDVARPTSHPRLPGRLLADNADSSGGRDDRHHHNGHQHPHHVRLAGRPAHPGRRRGAAHRPVLPASLVPA